MFCRTLASRSDADFQVIIRRDTSFAGASLDDLIHQLTGWCDLVHATAASIDEAISSEGFPAQAETFCRYSVRVLIAFGADYHRLVTELPTGVLPAHITLVRNMCDDVRTLDRRAIRFNSEVVEGLDYQGESGRIGCTIYRDVREVAADMLDLANVGGQLETFVGVFLKAVDVVADPLPVLDLKPNIFEFGINLNYLLGWLRRRRNKRWTSQPPRRRSEATMRTIEISEAAYRQVRGFIPVAEAVLDEPVSVMGAVEILMELGLQSGFRQVVNPNGDDPLGKSFDQLAVLEPETVGKFIADRVALGADLKALEARRTIRSSSSV